jgi:hypothetical protein
MKKKIKVYSIGVLVCIIFDVAFATLVTICSKTPVSDYILMGIFLLISDFMIIGMSSTYLKEESGNKCLVIKLTGTVDDDSLPELK